MHLSHGLVPVMTPALQEQVPEAVQFPALLHVVVTLQKVQLDPK